MSVQSQLQDAIGQAMRLIAEKREAYVRSWIAETGLHPTECQLVEKHVQERDGVRITITVEAKPRAQGG